MEKAARALLDLGASKVILKGGHMQSMVLTDLLIDDKNMHTIETKKSSLMTLMVQVVQWLQHCLHF